MRDLATTRSFYEKLGFAKVGGDYPDYLMMRNGSVEIHFFGFAGLDPSENYGQVYLRTNDIDGLYRTTIDGGIQIHPNGALVTKPWRVREFALLDPDSNLLTFGQAV